MSQTRFLIFHYSFFLVPFILSCFLCLKLVFIFVFICSWLFPLYISCNQYLSILFYFSQKTSVYLWLLFISYSSHIFILLFFPLSSTHYSFFYLKFSLPFFFFIFIFHIPSPSFFNVTFIVCISQHWQVLSASSKISLEEKIKIKLNLLERTSVSKNSIKFRERINRLKQRNTRSAIV